jgi:hypothetical protein
MDIRTRRSLKVGYRQVQGDGSFWLILSFHVILTDKARIIQSIKS